MRSTPSAFSLWEPTPDGWRCSQALRALHLLMGQSGTTDLDGASVAAVLIPTFCTPDAAADRRTAWDSCPEPVERTRLGRFQVVRFADGSGLAGLLLEEGVCACVLPSVPFVGTPDADILDALWTPMPHGPQPFEAEPQGTLRLFPNHGWRGPTYPNAMRTWTGVVGSLRSIFPDFPVTVILEGAHAHGPLRCRLSSPAYLDARPDQRRVVDALTGLARHLFPGMLGYRQVWDLRVLPGSPQDPRVGQVIGSTLTGGTQLPSQHAKMRLLEALFAFHPGSQAHHDPLPTIEALVG